MIENTESTISVTAGAESVCRISTLTGLTTIAHSRVESGIPAAYRLIRRKDGNGNMIPMLQVLRPCAIQVDRGQGGVGDDHGSDGELIGGPDTLRAGGGDGSGSDDVALPADVVGVLNGKECVWAVGRVDKLNHLAGILECLVGAG